MPRQRLAGSTSLEQRTHLKLVRPLQIGRAPEFVGGKARRSRPKSRSRSKRSVRNSQKPQRSHFGDVGLSQDGVVYATLANLRSLPAFGGPKQPKPTHPLQGNTNATGRSDFKPNAFAAERIHADHSPRRSQPNARPKAGLWTRDKPARRARSAGPCPFYSRDREREHPTHASGWRAPPSPERIGRSGRDEIFRPTYFPFPS